MNGYEIEQLAGCKNGPCPKIFRFGARAAVQGEVGTELGTYVRLEPGQVAVEIPFAILAEAARELGGEADVAASSFLSGSGCDQGLLRMGDRVVVRGVVKTDLTREINPAPGEDVVEIPFACLVEAIRELVVA